MWIVESGVQRKGLQRETHFVSHQSTECAVDEIAKYWGLNPCTLGICSKTFWALP